MSVRERMIRWLGGDVALAAYRLALLGDEEGAHTISAGHRQMVTLWTVEGMGAPRIIHEGVRATWKEVVR